MVTRCENSAQQHICEMYFSYYNSVSIYIICKCLSWDEKHCKPIIGTYTIHATNKSKEKVLKKSKRKKNKLDRFTFMNADG